MQGKKEFTPTPDEIRMDALSAIKQLKNPECKAAALFLFHCGLHVEGTLENGHRIDFIVPNVVNGRRRTVEIRLEDIDDFNGQKIVSPDDPNYVGPSITIAEKNGYGGCTFAKSIDEARNFLGDGGTAGLHIRNARGRSDAFILTSSRAAYQAIEFRVESPTYWPFRVLFA